MFTEQSAEARQYCHTTKVLGCHQLAQHHTQHTASTAGTLLQSITEPVQFLKSGVHTRNHFYPPSHTSTRLGLKGQYEVR